MISTRLKALIVLATAGLAVTAFLVWHYRESIQRVDVNRAVDWIASFGPIPFFASMALLPLLWAPVSPFLLLAGAIYGLPTALIGCFTALSINMALSWLLAGKLFRPAFERLAHRFGYSVPELTRKNLISVAILIRITPGTPFPLQNYLLGLARMPFGWYMGISVPITVTMAFSIILFGDAILKGDLAIILGAIALFLVLALAVKQLRTRLRNKSLGGEIL